MVLDSKAIIDPANSALYSSHMLGSYPSRVYIWFNLSTLVNDNIKSSYVENAMRPSSQTTNIKSAQHKCQELKEHK